MSEAVWNNPVAPVVASLPETWTAGEAFEELAALYTSGTDKVKRVIEHSLQIAQLQTYAATGV